MVDLSDRGCLVGQVFSKIEIESETLRLKSGVRVRP